MAKQPRTVVFENPSKTHTTPEGQIVRSNYTRNGKFPSRKKEMPQAKTVGQMIEILSQLPKGLPLEMNDCAVRPVWYNVGSTSEALTFEEGKEIES